jgi:hypothetical protein
MDERSRAIRLRDQEDAEFTTALASSGLSRGDQMWRTVAVFSTLMYELLPISG